MKKKALKKLSNALRSGEFQQYRGKCYNKGSYCVLGVANCVFSGASGKDQGDLYSLNDETKKAIGFADRMPYFLGYGLFELNDGSDKLLDNTGVEHLNFDELADLIEIALMDGPKNYFHQMKSRV